jgi:hypothetical protein
VALLSVEIPFMGLNALYMNNLNISRTKIYPFFVTKKKIYMVLTAFLLNPLNACHAGWSFISSDSLGNNYYYDDSKTVRETQSEQVSTWLLTSYSQALSGPNGEPTLSVIQDLSYSCRTGYESYKQFYIGYYAGSEGSGTSLGAENTPNSPWERVIPDTMSDVLFQFFCKPDQSSKDQSGK